MIWAIRNFVSNLLLKFCFNNLQILVSTKYATLLKIKYAILICSILVILHILNCYISTKQ